MSLKDEIHNKNWNFLLFLFVKIPCTSFEQGYKLPRVGIKRKDATDNNGWPIQGGDKLKVTINTSTICKMFK